MAGIASSPPGKKHNHDQGMLLMTEKTIIERFNQAIDAGLCKGLFDHLRNYLICSLLFAAGIHAYQYPSSVVFGFSNYSYAGFGIMAIAVVFGLINFYDGIRRLSRFRYNILFNVIMLLVYIVFSIRLIEITLEFRIS